MTYNAAAGTTETKEFKSRYQLWLVGMKSTPSHENPNEFSIVTQEESFSVVARYVLRESN